MKATLRVILVPALAALALFGHAVARAEPPPPSGTTIFSDDFSTKNTSLWRYSAGASISNGQLVQAVDQVYDGQVITPIAYDFTDCTFTGQLLGVPAVGNTETGLSLNVDPRGLTGAGTIYMEWNGLVQGATSGPNGQLLASQDVPPPPGIAHYYYMGGQYTSNMWFRIRHSSATGLLYWETSLNGTNWTTLASETPIIEITSLYPTISTGWWPPGPSSPGAAVWDNVSLVRNTT